jgi:signal transduction histidine kinase
MTAVLGNRGPGLPGLLLPSGADDPELRRVAVGEEGIGALVAVPVSFGGEVRGVLHAGLRREGPFPAGAVEALTRLCTYAGAALAAARDRARVEEVAALRERRRLARALHDELGQRLFGIGVAAQLARASARSGRPELIGQLQGLEQQIAGASGALRATLRALDRPPAPAGAMVVTLREDVAAFSARAGVPAHLLVMGEPAPLDEARADLLVRTCQEGLRNVERHAGALEVVVTLAFEDGWVELVVQDDGAGVAASPPGNGLGLGMIREEVARLGGDLRLGRGDDHGTTMRARLPLR